jgi:hypothetical protein
MTSSTGHAPLPMSLLHAINSHINLVYVGGGTLSVETSLFTYSSPKYYCFVSDNKVTGRVFRSNRYEG